METDDYKKFKKSFLENIEKMITKVDTIEIDTIVIQTAVFPNMTSLSD